MPRSGPPAYAWDWFARQRLLWREARSRLAAQDAAVAARYRGVDQRGEVVSLLRADYPRDTEVRAVVDAVVRELAFLSRTSGRWADLGLRSAPRGQRWWWTALTGEDLDHPDPAAPRTAAHPSHRQLALDELAATDPQLVLDDVAEGYGDR